MAKLKDYKRVLGPAEACYVAGNWLKKRGIRFTALAGIAGLGALATDVIVNKFGYDLPIKTIDTAIIPAVAAIATFIPGQALTTFSNIFSSQKLLSAEANALNLMEDRKKQELETHLGILWDNVFKYESELRNNRKQKNKETYEIQKNKIELEKMVESWPNRLKEHFQIKNENIEDFLTHIARYKPLSSTIESTREGFIISAGYALKNALPQSVEKNQIGFDLSLLEDWYDGGICDSNDTKLSEQYFANNHIRGIRKKIGIPKTTKIKEAFSKNPAPLWHTLTTRKIGKEVGGLIEKFNQKYTRRNESDYFNAQHFLWKSPETDALVEKELGKEACLDLQSARKKMIRRIFSEDKKTAHNQIYWMFGRDFTNALNTSLDYDIEFATEKLNHTPIEDIKELDSKLLAPIYSMKIAAKKMKQAKINLNQVDNFLKEELPEIYSNPLKRRAARIGYHLNRFNLQKLIGKDKEKAKEIFNERVTLAEPRYSERISHLRTHYELSKIQLRDYIKLIDELGEYN